MSCNNHLIYNISYYSISFYQGIKFFLIIAAHIYVNSKLSFLYLLKLEVVTFKLFSKVDAPNDNISDSLRHPLRYA